MDNYYYCFNCLDVHPKGYECIYMEERSKPYVCAGRNETEEEARKLDAIMRSHIEGRKDMFVVSSDTTFSISKILGGLTYLYGMEV